MKIFGKSLAYIAVLCVLAGTLFVSEMPETEAGENERLEGQRAAVLVDEGFHPGETPQPIEYLEENGAEVIIVGVEKGTVPAAFGDLELDIEKTVTEIDPDTLDALVIPGGDSPEKLIEHEEVLEFTRECVEADVIVGAICHGVLVPIEADVMEGRNATCVVLDDYWDVVVKLRNAEATFIDQPVVVDGNIITSRLPKDVTPFKETVAAAMEKGADLYGYRLGILIEDGYHVGETRQPIEYFEERGAEIVILGVEDKTVTSGNHELEVDKTVGDVDVADLDALVIPGGDSPEKLIEYEEVLDFTRDCVDAGILVAAICHGVLVPIEADVLEGLRATCVVLDDYWDVVVRLRDAGATFIDRPVVVDGKIITSRLPWDVPYFKAAIAEAIRGYPLDSD